MAELKAAGYKGFGRYCGSVAYAVNGTIVVYAGLTAPSKVASTIPAAKEVIRSITQAEGIVDLSQYRIFDILTCRGYYRKPGHFDVMEVIIEGGSPRFQAVDPDVLPPEMLALFEKIIG